MAMLDEIKAAENAAAERRDEATRLAKEYAALSAARAETKHSEAVNAAEREAAAMLGRAAEESRLEAKVIIGDGRAADRVMLAECEKKLSAAADAVFAEIG